jgi:hypothetical protein
MTLPDDFVFPEPVEDVVHPPDKPFCYDPDCSCHEDDVLIYQVYLWYKDGLMTAHEASDFVAGKGI